MFLEDAIGDRDGDDFFGVVRRSDIEDDRVAEFEFRISINDFLRSRLRLLTKGLAASATFPRVRHDFDQSTLGHFNFLWGKVLCNTAKKKTKLKQNLGKHNNSR